MRIRILTIVSVGITIGLLLGMGIVSVLRGALEGNAPGMEITFTALVALMAAGLLTYVIKTTH